MTKKFESVKQLYAALGLPPEVQNEDMSIVIKGVDDKIITEMPVSKLFEGLYKIIGGDNPISLDEEEM